MKTKNKLVKHRRQTNGMEESNVTRYKGNLAMEGGLHTQGDKAQVKDITVIN